MYLFLQLDYRSAGRAAGLLGAVRLFLVTGTSLILAAAPAAANSDLDAALAARYHLEQRGFSLSPPALEALIFQEDAKPKDRRAAALALPLGSDPASIATLAHCLESTPAEVSSACLKGLGFFNDPAAVEAISGVLWDPSPHLRIQAIRSLRVIGSETALSLIIETAGHSLQSNEVRYAAIRSLRAHELEDAPSLPDTKSLAYLFHRQVAELAGRPGHGSAQPSLGA